MARAKPAAAAGEREQRLLARVDEIYGNTAAFARDVASRTGLSPASEKSAFYRIIRGAPGDRVEWRLRHYAALLKIDTQTLVSEWEAPTGAADAAARPFQNRLQALEEEVVSLRRERDSALEAIVVRLAEIEAALVNAGLLSGRKASAKGRPR